MNLEFNFRCVSYDLFLLCENLNVNTSIEDVLSKMSENYALNF